MDPLTAATTFATIIGLVANFRQEKGNREDLNHRDFAEWLVFHKHEELKEFMLKTEELRSEVDSLLHEDHALMLEKLDSVSKMLATILSRIDGFKGIAKAVIPDAEISNQAYGILECMIDVNAGFILPCPTHDGYSFITNVNKEIHVAEMQFIEDDLNVLVECGLLRHSFNSQGSDLYHITRSAVRYVETIRKNKK